MPPSRLRHTTQKAVKTGRVRIGPTAAANVPTQGVSVIVYDPTKDRIGSAIVKVQS